MRGDIQVDASSSVFRISLTGCEQCCVPMWSPGDSSGLQRHFAIHLRTVGLSGQDWSSRGGGEWGRQRAQAQVARPWTI